MKVVSFATARSFPELRPILDRSWTKHSRSSVIRANTWSPLRSIVRRLTQPWVGSVVLVLNEMVLVLVIDAVGPSTSTSRSTSTERLQSRRKVANERVVQSRD